MRSQNPFIYNAPVAPDRFIGRTQEIDQILSQLANPARGSSAISGDPRVGKTSLLHYMGLERVREAWGLSPDWCHFIYLDCHSIIPFSEERFWRYILRALEYHLRDDEALSNRVKWLLVSDQVGPEIYDLNSLFDEIARAGHLVVLLLDEFEGIVENLEPKTPELLYHLRALLNRPERGLALVIGSRAPLKRLCAELLFAGSPFDNSFAAITLSPFSESEVDQLLTHYQAAFSEEERDLLRQLAGRHPYLVQLTASLILNGRAALTEDENGLGALETDLERETERYFSDILDHSGESQKAHLTWLALHQWSQQLPPEATGLGSLNQEIERHDQDLSHLEQRGLVLSHSDGPTLFSPVFGPWILRKVLIPNGEAILTRWEATSMKRLPADQQQAVRHIVRQMVEWPAIIRDPKFFLEISSTHPKVSQSLPEDEILGRYIIEELIATGSLSDIYRAYDPHLERTVAIKKLRTPLSNAKKERARFERGARAIATLRHPHIVQIFDFDIQSSRPYMVMEYIEGRSLTERLAELQASGETFPWDKILRIATHIAEALEFVHARQMIHRGVSPDNILLADNDEVFLAGFSLVRLLDQPTITLSGQRIGSLAYMAPEQVRGESKQVDYRADIYALGCVVYEMITARPPFPQEELPLAHVTQSPVLPHHEVPNLPEIAGETIMKALAKDPANRPLSASQFVKDLRQALKGSRPIQITGSFILPDPQAVLIKQLYAESVHARIARVRIHKELRGGFTQASVILAQPIDDRGRALANEVIKIGPASMLRRENNRYRRFVHGRLPMTAVSLERGPVELGGIGCLSYGFVGDQPIGAVRDLEAYYDEHSPEEVAESLTKLMEPLDARWYGQNEPLLVSFADEYGEDLPPHLTLKTERIADSREALAPGLHQPVDVETILQAGQQLEIGNQVLIHDLLISEIKPYLVKLRRASDGPEIWVRARLTTPRPDLREGERVTVLGTIAERRGDLFDTALTGILNVIPTIERQSKRMIAIAGLPETCPDPLTIYEDLLRQELNGRQSIVHGDFHPGNILVDDSGRAWLIDFDHVREGHVMYDFIKLEIILRLFVLGRARHLLGKLESVPEIPPLSEAWPHRFSLADYANFETALLQRTTNHATESIARPDLAKAADVILAIRRLARHYLRQPDEWNEYFIGLHLHSLAQLKFYHNHPQLSILPFTTATVVGQHLRTLID